MRILLVEDYLPLQKSVTQGLREAGYAVDVTGDGKEGLWFASTNPYDIIVLDLMLPGLDGMSLLRELRAKEIQTHVLVLTARGEVAERIAGLNAGADDYLVKPFAFEELLSRIQALLRRNYRRKNPEIVIAGLRIDTTAQRVWREQNELNLTAREYALLEYLAMRQGATVSRSDIWEHVYDFYSSATSNVVDVYIGYIRKKIDLPDHPSLIRTVRGRGYVLEEEP